MGVMLARVQFCVGMIHSDSDDHPPGGVVGNMLASHAVNPGSIPGRGDTRMITIMAVPCHWIPSGT